MVNPLYPFNYFPLVSGSGGQDSLYSSDSCSKKTPPHGKSVSIRGRIKNHPHGKFAFITSAFRCFLMTFFK